MEIDIKEKQMFEKLQSMFSKDGVLIDVGGCKGAWTENALKFIGNKSVYIFEPNKSNIEELQSKFKDKRNIILINKAVGDKIGFKNFFNLTGNDDIIGMSGLIKRSVYDRYQYTIDNVDVTTLDAQFGLNHDIDFLKIDTEGYEFNVLKGMDNILLNSKVKFIQFEYGGTYIDANIKLSEVASFLKKYNYNIFDFNSNTFVKVEKFNDNDYSYTNFLATKENL